MHPTQLKYWPLITGLLLNLGLGLLQPSSGLFSPAIPTAVTAPASRTVATPTPEPNAIISSPSNPQPTPTATTQISSSLSSPIQSKPTHTPTPTPKINGSISSPKETSAPEIFTPTPLPILAPVLPPTATPTFFAELTQARTPFFFAMLCGAGLLLAILALLTIRLTLRRFQPLNTPAPPSQPVNHNNLHKTVLCPNCQRENREEAYFCQHCGQPMPSAPASSANGKPQTQPLPMDTPLPIVYPTPTDETFRLLNRPSPSELARLDIGQNSDMGRRRPHNEDSHLVIGLTGIFSPPPAPAGLFVVADGMGGHQAGEVASRTAVLSIAQQVSENKLSHQRQNPNHAGEWLSHVMQDANKAVFEQRRLAGNNMGTTLVTALWLGEKLYIANIGDSRAYILNSQGIQQITVDHSMVELWVAAGKITREEAATHSQRNVIYRMVGDRLQVEVDLFEHTLASDEAVLLCSDGLSGMVPDPQIWQIWQASQSAQETCDRLVAAANEAGGEDNITVVVAGRTRES